MPYPPPSPPPDVLRSAGSCLEHLPSPQVRITTRATAVSESGGPGFQELEEVLTNRCQLW